MKLFLVMGLNWTLEILSSVSGGPAEIWIPTDIINTLQGVFIFILCVWTTKVRESVTRRLFPRFARTLSTQPAKSATKSSDICESVAAAPVAISMKNIQKSMDEYD